MKYITTGKTLFSKLNAGDIFKLPRDSEIKFMRVKAGDSKYDAICLDGNSKGWLCSFGSETVVHFKQEDRRINKVERRKGIYGDKRG